MRNAFLESKLFWGRDTFTVQPRLFTPLYFKVSEIPLEIILCPLFFHICIWTSAETAVACRRLGLGRRLPQQMYHLVSVLWICSLSSHSSCSVEDLPSFGRTEDQCGLLSVFTSLTQNVLASSLVFSCFVLPSEENIHFLFTHLNLSCFLISYTATHFRILRYSWSISCIFHFFLCTTLHWPSVYLCLPSLKIITLPVQILPQATTLPCLLFITKFLFQTK